MNPQRPLKQYEWVMNDLKRQMDEGSLQPGDRLSSVVDLALQYNVGRSTIREALSALKAMGLLNIRQGGGTFVRTPPADAPPVHPGQLYADLWEGRAASLRHLLEVRRVLETGCAAVAATNRSQADLTVFEEILREMENAADEQVSEQADVKFHQQIAAATHNPLLLDLMESLSNKLHENMKDMRALWFYAERSSAERLLQEHASIYKAIRTQDAKEALARMEAHISKVEQVLNEKGAGDQPL
ncbi:FadR/GntR family transcriptional regulator [Paenibacillus sp. XY044]|uniref:FadR/GntR family transcriptional regulator n=1 Tax=Paenibacillus sp. XY044 TaxID=2026089 RepID=UPI000B9892E6|nr:FadR/GntR family transcriptional regulator [Paenibacillus sp. XY044]OZB90836.1 GntR family transcriptional regulator [Paenibacillus sp. XY044]